MKRTLLPVYNKSYILIKVTGIGVIFIPLILVRINATSVDFVFDFLLLLIASTYLIISTIYFVKNNIRTVQILDNSLLIEQGKDSFEVNLNEIVEIDKGLMSTILFSHNLIYTLTFNERKKFGKKLFLSYPNWIDQNKEPKDIIELREKIETT